MKKSLLTGLFCATVALCPLTSLWADDDDHEHHRSCNDCGVVTSVQAVASGASGLGAAAGALAGGLAGHQASKGDTATTVLGVAGGALTAHYAEKALTSTSEWTIAVRMDSGDARTVTVKSEPTVKPGERVRVGNGSVTRYEEAARKGKSEHEDEKDD
jgi:outer membrane lipoprotein SlyB